MRGFDLIPSEAAEDALRGLRLLQACPPTVRQVVNAGDKAHEASGINPWCINEGLASGDEPYVPFWLGDTIRAFEQRNEPDEEVEPVDLTDDSPWHQWSAKDLEQEIRNRLDHFFKMRDGSMAFPNSAHGDVIKMVHILLNKRTNGPQ